MAFGIIDILSLSQGGFTGIDSAGYVPISFPLSLPSPLVNGVAVAPRRVSFRAMEAIAITQSPFTYLTQVQSYDADMWIAEVVLPPMERDAAEEWNAFLLTLQGQKGTFLLGDPLGGTPRGVATGTPLVKDGGQTGRVLTTKGWTPDVTNILRKGDWIGIGQRGYKLLRDVDSDSSGDAILDIFPKLREVPPQNEPIITSNVKVLMRLSSSTRDVWSADETRTYAISFSAIEALS